MSVKRYFGCAGAGVALVVMGMATAHGAAGPDLENAVVKADPVGHVLHVDGIIGPKFESDVRDALTRDPAIRQVVVRSPGGMRAPAMRVADFINKRGVTVRVEGKCASACVLLWATAASREMTEDSRIGLHRSSLDPALPIPDAMRQQLMERNDRETDAVLRKAGFSTRVVAMGAATPPTAMTWFTPGELKTEGLPFRLVEARTGQTMANASASSGSSVVGVAAH